MREWFQWLRSDRILVQQNYASAPEVLTALAHLFQENVDVAPGYTAALLRREQEFPTGLPTMPYGVAIPHADGQYVIRSGLAVCTLSTPIPFQEMGNPIGVVSVRLAILIALPMAQQRAQAEVLQWLLSLIQRHTFLHVMAESDSVAQIMEAFQQYT